MRIGIFEQNKSIYYPDEISFCFNPIPVKVQTDNQVTVIMTDSHMAFTDTREPYGGIVKFDISIYLQSFFDVNDKELIVPKTISVQVQTTDDTFTFTTLVIWGAMNIDEVFNPSRKIVWFRRFPFTFSMYISPSARLRKRYDKNKYEPLRLDAGLLHIDPMTLFGNAVAFGVVRLDEDIPTSTFDYTFDNTFRPVGDGTIINRLVIDDSECGIYLRWIDRHGFYQYWLFQEGNRYAKSDMDGERLYWEYSDERYNYTGVNRYQRKTMQKNIKACAVLVDQYTFNMLMTLHSSPLVDLYVDGKWVPVNIVTGTIVDSGEDLQDFEVEIMLPEINSQKL